MNDDTLCLHAGYTPGNAEPRVAPIVQSTTYVYNKAADMAAVFDDPTKSLVYSRFANPTVMAVEEKIAALEGGAGAMCTASGQAAIMMCLLNLCGAGDGFVCSSKVYGGSVNLLAVTLKRLGIRCVFVDPDASEDVLDRAFDSGTRAVFGETLANPALTVLDIEKFARVAHRHGVPLIVDNTLATPVLCKPLGFGADIVVHSTSKYMDGHAVQVGGVIVDGGAFDWSNGRFPEFTGPDESYHGISYTKTYGRLAFIIKARMQLMRDFGAYPAAHSAFLLNLGLETLPMRMRRYCENAFKVARFLEGNAGVERVNYPWLEGCPGYALAQKYLTGGSGVISFVLKGGGKGAERFMDALALISKEVHVADIRSSVLHPAGTTHRQLTAEQLLACGVDPGMIRLSVGLEDADDIITDLERALSAP